MATDKITAILTDLDGCLWTGILAEKENIILNQEYYDQLKSLFEKGIQLFVISKNEINDVLNAFENLGINKNIFTHVVANWEPKYLNIENILHHTNIRPETAIFVDDNVLELNEVKSKIHGVKCCDFSVWDHILKSNYFENLKIQSETEIRERINRYKTSIDAAKLKGYIGEDISFLKLLNRKISLGEISSKSDIERFAKLLTLTHRINFNPGKFINLNEALSFVNKIGDKYKLIGVSVWESDLSLGLSGGFVIKLKDSIAYVEDATFSCGIIGRDFEQKAIIELIYGLKKIGIKEVIFFVKLTSTNVRVGKILNELEFKKRPKDAKTTLFSLNITNYKPFKKYDWIKVIGVPSFSEHLGIPSVIDFFDKHVRLLISKEQPILNLGSAKGEVLGLLQPERNKQFYDFIQTQNSTITKVDIDEYPEEQNIIGNAENLKSIFSDESFNLVMAIELLEHTQHFWNVINEMIRICKTGGHIFISIPSFSYPKHEYPIDLWRIGPITLLSFFPKEKFEVVKFVKEGDQKHPRRLMIIAKKKVHFKSQYLIPRNGKTDWKTGITYFK